MAKLMYENRCLLTRRLHRQYYKVSFRKMQRRMRILFLLIAAVCFAAALFLLLYGRGMAAGVILLSVGAYFVFLMFAGERFMEWVHFRRLEDEHGKGIVNIVRFFSDRVQVQVNQTSFYFKYATIVGAYETEDLLILLLKADGMAWHGQMIYKRGFTDRSESVLDDFKAYIRQRTGKDIFLADNQGEMG